MDAKLRRIILVLLNQSSFITRDAIADKMDLSVSTIKKELQILPNILKQYNLILNSKKGIGIQIIGSNSDKYKLKQEILIHTNDSNRVNEIAYALLISDNNTISIDEICNRYYISRTSVLNDIEKLKKRFEKYQINLEQLKGKSVYKLSGSENNIRKCLFDIIKNNQNEESYDYVTSYENVCKWLRKNANIDSNKIKIGIDEMLDHLNLKYSDTALNALTMHIAISIIRLQQGNSMVENTKESTAIMYPVIYKEIKLFTCKLEKLYRIKFNANEINTIYEYLLNSNNLVENIGLFEAKDVEIIADEIIRLVSNTRNIQIYNKSLEKGLILHLIPLMHRIISESYLKNPLLEKIKEEYPDAFGLSWMTNSIFKERFGKVLPEDEIGFIAIHIEAMLEQSESRIKTVIVCSYGVGVSQLLASKIENRFSRLNIMAVIEEGKIKKYDNGEVDLFLSTFPLHTKTYNIFVNPLLLSDDISRISYFIDSFSRNTTKLLDQIKFLALSNQEFESQKDLFQKAEIFLNQKRLIKQGFLDNIMEREKKCSTSIGFETAIPHVSEEYINKSFICLITNERLIDWGNDKVNVVLVLGITTEDMKRINVKIRNFYRQLYDPQIHSKLLTIKDETELKELLNV